jgi:hypothetical protein
MNGWLRRLEFEIGRQCTECSKYEMRHSQLVELLRLEAIPASDQFTARLMVVQLSRWLGSFVGGKNPDDYRPLYPLDEIDQFAERCMALYAETEKGNPE